MNLPLMFKVEARLVDGEGEDTQWLQTNTYVTPAMSGTDACAKVSRWLPRFDVFRWELDATYLGGSGTVLLVSTDVAVDYAGGKHVS